MSSPGFSFAMIAPSSMVVDAAVVVVVFVEDDNHVLRETMSVNVYDQDGHVDTRTQIRWDHLAKDETILTPDIFPFFSLV